MTDILISVVLPVYNGSRYLDESITSILKQSYANFEFIIINDGSTDESLRIIEKYALQDSRIQIINRQNKGLVYSLNEGIRKAKGKYIARMDADDISDIYRLESQIKHIEKNNLDICGGHSLFINNKGNINGANIVPISHKMCGLSLLFKVPFAHPSVMIRKGFLVANLLEYGQSSYKAAEDLDLWIRMYNSGARFGNVDSVVLKLRVCEDSLSRLNSVKIRKESTLLHRQFNKDNYQQFKEIIKDLPPSINSEEKSLLTRYIYNEIKRLKLSNILLLRRIDKKIVLKSIFSAMLR